MVVIESLDDINNRFIPGEMLVHMKTSYMVTYLGTMQDNGQAVSFVDFNGKINKADLSEYRPSYFLYDFLDEKGKVKRFYSEPEDLAKLMHTSKLLFFVMIGHEREVIGVSNNGFIAIKTINKIDNETIYFMPIPGDIADTIVLFNESTNNKE